MTRTQRNERVFQVCDRIKAARPDMWSEDDYEKLIRRTEGGDPDDVFLDGVQLGLVCKGRQISMLWALFLDGHPHDLWMEEGIHISSPGIITVEKTKHYVEILKAKIEFKEYEARQRLFGGK